MTRADGPSRVRDATSILLHSTPWRETSLLLEAFSREHGRHALVAKGARRPHSALRPVLIPFQPVALSWSGSGEVRTLVRAEWNSALRVYQGPALMSAWYMNEVMLKLLPREDPHPTLYDAYDAALRQLAAGGGAALALRRFEWMLLRETGYGLEGEMPAFDDPRQEPLLRQRLHARLDVAMEGRSLATRRVLRALKRTPG